MNNTEIYSEKIIKGLNFYFSILVVPIGLILNIITIYIFSRDNLQKYKLGYLYIFSAFYDSLAIFSFIFYKYLPTEYTNIESSSSFICHTYQFFMRSLQHTPSVFQVLLALDRFFKVVFVSKQLGFTKKFKTLLFISVIIFISILVVNSFNLTKYLDYDKNKCVIAKEYSILTDIISCLIRTILPSLFIFVFNIVIIVRLVKSKNKLNLNKNLSVNSFKNEDSDGNVKDLKEKSGGIFKKKEYQFAFTVMLMNLLFCLFNFPLSITYLITNISKYEFNKSSVEMASIDIAHAITNMIAYTYHGFSFFNNFLFNSLFKKEVYLVLNSFKNLIENKRNLFRLKKVKIQPKLFNM